MNHPILTYFVNFIVAIFLAMVGIILTLDFQEILRDGEYIFRIVMSIIWSLGLFIVILKGYTINWSIWK